MKNIKGFLEDIGYNIIDIRRMGPTVICIKFKGPLPEAIKFPFKEWPSVVEKYSPGPMRCWNCLKYGHHISECKNKVCCVICGGEHKKDDCDKRAPICPNCGGSHGPTAPDCPINIQIKKERNEKLKKKKIESAMVEKEAFSCVFGDFPPLKGKPTEITEENKIIEEVGDDTQSKFSIMIEKIIEKKMKEFEIRIAEMLENLIQKFTEKITCQLEQINTDKGQIHQTEEDRLMTRLGNLMDSRLEGSFHRAVSDVLGQFR